MNAFLKKSAIAVTALTLGLGAVATTTPAEAGGWGWHGGGGWGWGPAVGLGVLGGVAAGAVIASQSPYYYGGYGPGPYYGGPYAAPGPYAAAPDGCAAYRPVYDGYGRYIGRRLVDIC
ncbi:MAG TPA: hypothetical protein VGH40_18950 [Roseiarcus sp.]